MDAMMILAITAWGEILAFGLAFVIVLAGLVATWVKFSERLNKVEKHQTDMDTDIRANHRTSIDKIEAMRIERHTEIMELRAEITSYNRDLMTENKAEHKEIKDYLSVLSNALTALDKSLAIVVSEIKITKEIRIRNGGPKKPVKT